MKSTIICFLHWNDFELLEERVIIFLSEGFDVVVIDNGSDKECRQRLSQFGNDNSIHLIWNNENFGFGPAINKGISYGLDSGYDSLFYCNNDISIVRGTIGEFLNGLNPPNIYLIYPILLERGKECIGGAKMESRMNTRVYEGNEMIDVEYAPGTFFAVKLELFNKLNRLDERYFFGGEMAHLCRQMKMRSFEFVLQSDIQVRHMQDNEFSPQKTYYNWRNRYVYLRSFNMPFKFYIFWTFKLCFQVCLSIIKLDWVRLRVALYSIFHGIVGRAGRFDGL